MNLNWVKLNQVQMRRRSWRKSGLKLLLSKMVGFRLTRKKLTRSRRHLKAFSLRNRSIVKRSIHCSWSTMLRLTSLFSCDLTWKRPRTWLMRDKRLLKSSRNLLKFLKLTRMRSTCSRSKFKSSKTRSTLSCWKTRISKPNLRIPFHYRAHQTLKLPHRLLKSIE